MAPRCSNACSAGWSRLLHLLLFVHLHLLGSTPCWCADEQPAGYAELDAMERQIADLQRALAASQAQLDADHAQERTFLEQTAQQLLGDWQDPSPAPEPALDDVPGWYLELWRRHDGFAPLHPLSGWQRSWAQLRASERPRYDRYEELAVACHRLEHLRDRLRRQLQQRADAPGSPSAWSGP